jgi:hypothetical protein
MITIQKEKEYKPMRVTTIGAAYYSLTISGKEIWDTGMKIVAIYPSKPGYYTVVYSDGTCGINYSSEYRVMVEL